MRQKQKGGEAEGGVKKKGPLIGKDIGKGAAVSLQTKGSSGGDYSVKGEGRSKRKK